MKKMFLMFICLIVTSAAVFLIGCGESISDIEVVYPTPEAQTDSITQQPAATATQEDPTLTDTPSQTEAPSVSPTVTSVETVEPTPEPSPVGMSPEPSNTMEFYSSYAHMVSYDPARGWADFDYFDMLYGADAVDWLVTNEGYSETDAQAIVDDFADSEYVYKNTNPGLRTIDLKDIDITLQFQSDGTQVPEGIPSIVDDVYALYNFDPDYLYDHAFFYIHVDSEGEVTHVEQVYWP